MPKSKDVKRDDRDFDTTSLSENMQGKALHRDYTAHWHRWSFARRYIKTTDHVLEVGCGVERPVWRMLFHGTMPKAASYTGVDYNPLQGGVGMGHKLSTILGGFDFTKRWKELIPQTASPAAKQGGYDVAINMEVIEHMKVEHGRKLLKGLFALLRPGGTLLLSTPVYDGKRHAANHIHEYLVPELQKEIERAGFVVERRFGTFMDVNQLKDGLRTGGQHPSCTTSDIKAVRDELAKYYDNDAISCIFAPLFPDHARNNLWVCRKPELI